MANQEVDFPLHCTRTAVPNSPFYCTSVAYIFVYLSLRSLDIDTLSLSADCTYTSKHSFFTDIPMLEITLPILTSADEKTQNYFCLLRAGNLSAALILLRKKKGATNYRPLSQRAQQIFCAFSVGSFCDPCFRSPGLCLALWKARLVRKKQTFPGNRLSSFGVYFQRRLKVKNKM